MIIGQVFAIWKNVNFGGNEDEVIGKETNDQPSINAKEPTHYKIVKYSLISLLSSSPLIISRRLAS